MSDDLTRLVYPRGLGEGLRPNEGTEALQGRQDVPEDGDLPFRCTAQDVADLLRARTKDADSNELGEFTEETRPTLEGVERLITRAVAEVIARTGELDDRWYLAARTLTALYAAMLVELSYFPEQVRTDRSAYPEYERLFTDGITELLSSMRGGQPGGNRVHSVPVYSETALAFRGLFASGPYGARGDMTLDEFEALIPRGRLESARLPDWIERPNSPAQRP